VCEGVDFFGAGVYHLPWLDQLFASTVRMSGWARKKENKSKATGKVTQKGNKKHREGTSLPARTYTHTEGEKEVEDDNHKSHNQCPRL
jgi:hypothetical protein